MVVRFPKDYEAIEADSGIRKTKRKEVRTKKGSVAKWDAGGKGSAHSPGEED